MVSIIIPLRQDQGYLKACIDACFEQDGVDVEVIVLPDEPLPWIDARIIQEPTGNVSPARKRNRGATLARGEILAFIDDDTRPRPGWLKAALVHFQDPKIGGVGGPSITPKDDPFWAQVSGAVYESWMMSGRERLRYCPGEECDVQDFPSCNLLVRREVFDQVGGFGTDFWPGEDTEFCLALVKKGFRIRYESRALIEHHRRPGLMRHFKQLGNYGLHRGYFAKRFPETSLRFQYFVPLLFVFSGTALTGLALMGNRIWAWVLLILILAYTILIAVSLSDKSVSLRLWSICVIFGSHVTYGISFFRGLMVRRLPEEISETKTRLTH